MPIRVLDSGVISRIAAGEVVERPASVVKELVENSLDAGATQITVEVRGGGISLIRVIDNGSGIPTEELELAFQRHATSKISSLDDLESINTLGFRGEALPSIAAVAQVEIVTCAGADSAGYLSLSDGAVVERGSRVRTRGMTVSVRNLFRNVPARLKFLKSYATENSHIASVVSQYALAFPGVRFVFLVEGRVALRTAGSGRLIDSIAQVYGTEIAGRMIDLGAEEEWQAGESPALHVSGMVGAPEVNRSSREYLSFFVNRRWVASRLLAWAVEEAYHGLLMTGRHPVAVINIAVPPGEIDVNIHPAKTEVRFRSERAVLAAVQKAVRRALISKTPVPRIEEVATSYAPVAQSGLPWEIISGPAPTPMAALPALRVVGQAMASYIVAEAPDGLYLIDQHAAHERILYEELMRQRSSREVQAQGLLEPVPVEVNPRQQEVLTACALEFSWFGFSLETFGEQTCLVRAVPAVLYDRDWMAALLELLDSPEGGDRAERIAISIACHGAVRAGQVLAGDEMRELIRRLEMTQIPHTCPHGRPTMVHLNPGQIEREFGRRT